MVKIEKIVEIFKEIWEEPIIKLSAILYGILALIILVSFYSTYACLGISIAFVIISYNNKKYSLGLNMLLILRVAVMLTIISLFLGLIFSPLTFALSNAILMHCLMFMTVIQMRKQK